jgi:hypothetical protein
MFQPFLEDFEKFKAELKEQYLDYWEENLIWMRKLGKEHFFNPHSQQPLIPKSPIVLSIIGALNPKVKDCLILLLGFNLSSEPSKIVEVLGLNFDPIQEIKKREKEREKKSETPNLESKTLSALSDTEYLDQIRQKINQTE